MSSRAITLDVREDLVQGREPLARIMAATRALAPDQSLRLLVPFEPVPLYGVLANLGFAHRARPTPDGAWEVIFSRGPVVAATETSAASTRASPSTPAAPDAPDATSLSAAECVELDARGLEPPQPMVAILEALAALPPGAVLRARTDRRPMRLYDQLETRGYAGETQETPDGSYITLIRRP